MLRRFEAEKKHIQVAQPFQAILAGLDPGPPAERWARLEPFNPNSPQQLLAYIRHRGHTVPRSLHSRRDTTSKMELERLAKRTHDPVYRKIIEVRDSTKMIGTYCDGWQPSSDDGRVHTEFYFAPGTGQLSSRNPNVQNAPKHGRLGKAFRRMIEARPGHVLIEFDFRGFHSLMLGFEAADQPYMRLSQLGIHDYLVSHIVREPADLSQSDAELAERFAWLKKRYYDIRENRAKRIVHGYGFGLTPRGAWMRYQDSFDSMKQVRWVFDLLDELFPKSAAWRQNIREQAHRQGHLLARSGALRYFFDVYHLDPKTGRVVYGDDSESAIAFLPANDAFGEKKDRMLDIHERGWSARYGLTNELHDAFLFECPEQYEDECIVNVQSLMESASMVLVDPVTAPSGLRCGVSVSRGRNWAEMEEIRATTN